MNKIKNLLLSAEKNMQFITLLESCIISLETSIKKELNDYVLLFHANNDVPIFSLNPSQKSLFVILGEIKYFISIEKIYLRLNKNALIDIHDVENALLDEIEIAINKFLKDFD